MGSSSHEERLPAVKDALTITIAEMLDSPSLLLESLYYTRGIRPDGRHAGRRGPGCGFAPEDPRPCAELGR